MSDERSKRLGQLRADAVGAPALNCAFTDGSFVLEATNPRTGEITVMARFDKTVHYDHAAFLARAGDDLRFLLDLLSGAFAEIRRLKQELEGKAKPLGDMAANCAMTCQSPSFARYLTERHSLPQGAEGDVVVDCVRQVLDIGSRRELNENTEAAKRWRDLRADFEVWMQQ